MAGLDPAIYAFAAHWFGAPDDVDHRVKPGDDEFQERRSAASQQISLHRTAVGQTRPSLDLRRDKRAAGAGDGLCRPARAKRLANCVGAVD